MKRQESSSTFVVTSREAAEALVDSDRQRYLLPFLARDCSVKEAARETGDKPNTMYVRVRRYVELGLLKVAYEEQRSGRAIKHYRTVAERFFIPYEVMGFETLEAMQARAEAYWEGELRRAILRARLENTTTWGFEIFRDEKGVVWVHSATAPGERYLASDPQNPATVNLWNDEVFLDFGAAKALQAELYELFERYRAKRGAQRYLLHIGLAPW